MTVPDEIAVVVTDGAGVTVIVREADLVLSAADVAVTVTVRLDAPPAGAV